MMMKSFTTPITFYLLMPAQITNTEDFCLPFLHMHVKPYKEIYPNICNN